MDMLWVIVSAVSSLVLATYAMADSAAPATTPPPHPAAVVATPAAPPPAEVKKEEPKAEAPAKVEAAKPATEAKRPAASRTAAPKGRAARVETRRAPDTKSLSDEAKWLLIPNQKYVLQFEDEENLGKVALQESTNVATTFSSGDVQQYGAAVQTLIDYRTQMSHHCRGESDKQLSQALERYLAGLCSFNRKALPLVADISENNGQMMLIVNRTMLMDAPILVSRYFQFKKQRFKETLDRFSQVDHDLIEAMVNIAKGLKVEITEADWNKSYGVRDNAIELVSLWPREYIFEATARLADIREKACVATIPEKKDK